MVFTVLLLLPQFVLRLEVPLLLSLSHIVTVCRIVVQLLNIPPKPVVVQAHAFKVRRCVSDIEAALLDLPLDTLDSIVNLDALVAAVVDGLLGRLEIGLEVPDDLALLSELVFVVALALRDLALKSTDAPLQI